MNSDEIRTAFLKFFEDKGHKVIPSSSLIPRGDPTLLLTNAGMVQIKPYFLGEAVPPSQRLASCQKCFRTTDIESVGDATHLTFFEMLGNFSVGEYFKKEAIAWAWEFVTGRLKLPPEKLWITIYLDDDASFKYWRETGVPEARIARFDEEDNFWGPAGSSGPCGPCSEIHYDFGEDKGCGKADCKPNCECGRFTEIWNLVFTQYNQDEAGNRTPLPRPNIDTGMGFERIVAVMQGKDSVYGTDLFSPLLDSILGLTGKKYGSNAEDDNAMRVVADHGRALAFLIADGVIPGNEGRGYVLRRLLRRAALFGRRLGLDKPFLAEIARAAIQKMSHIYPELQQRQDFIVKVIELEETRFEETLDEGLRILENEIIPVKLAYQKAIDDKCMEIIQFIDSFDAPTFISQKQSIIYSVIRRLNELQQLSLLELKKITHSFVTLNTVKPWDDLREDLKGKIDKLGQSPDLNIEELKKYSIDGLKIIKESQCMISGVELYYLYDTYGFPVELTKEIVAKSGYSVDMAGYEKEMEKQRERARASHKFDVVIPTANLHLSTFAPTVFIGYHRLEQKANIVRILVDGVEADTAEASQAAGLVLDTSPFYAEMGGQVGDTGEIIGPNGRFSVTDTVRVPPDITVHQGKVLDGSLTAGEEVQAVVNVERRRDIARNHTATHLLQAALRQVLGEHIQQRGSLVAPERLRFDFSHLAAMTREEITAVQRIVNEKIRQNLRVYDEESDYKKAIAAGAIALFDEKYGDTVRVMRIGEPAVSTELCGGTHVSFTGEIGYFHIVSEGSIGAGLRRIEAVTGREAASFIDRRFSSLEGIYRSLESSPEDAHDKIAGLLAELEKERKHTLSLERELAKKEAENLLGQVEVVKGVNILSARVSSDSQQVLREMADFVRDRLKSVIIVLGAVSGDRPVFIAAVTPDLVERGYHAGDIIKQVSKVAGGGGGGKANFAQAGGKDKNKLDEALRLVKSLI